MERLFIDPDLQATVTAITQEDILAAQASEDDASGISGLLHALLNDQHEVVIVYRETQDGAVKGSIRSRGRDITPIAEKFGGGGHKLAAGFKVNQARLLVQDHRWTIQRLQVSETE
jgi:phosphoesterase RecJ-like protein